MPHEEQCWKVWPGVKVSEARIPAPASQQFDIYLGSRCKQGRTKVSWARKNTRPGQCSFYTQSLRDGHEFFDVLLYHIFIYIYIYRHPVDKDSHGMDDHTPIIPSTRIYPYHTECTYESYMRLLVIPEQSSRITAQKIFSCLRSFEDLHQKPWTCFTPKIEVPRKKSSNPRLVGWEDGRTGVESPGSTHRSPGAVV